MSSNNARSVRRVQCTKSLEGYVITDAAAVSLPPSLRIAPWICVSSCRPFELDLSDLRVLLAPRVDDPPPSWSIDPTLSNSSSPRPPGRAIAHGAERTARRSHGGEDASQPRCGLRRRRRGAAPVSMRYCVVRGPFDADARISRQGRVCTRSLPRGTSR